MWLSKGKKYLRTRFPESGRVDKSRGSSHETEYEAKIEKKKILKTKNSSKLEP